MKKHELIGRIISCYDPEMSDTIDPCSGEFRSQFEYDPDCEEWYIITGIVETPTQTVLFGKEIRDLYEALDAKEVNSWMEYGRAIAVFGNVNFKDLVKKQTTTGLTMSPTFKLGVYSCGSRLIWWNIYNGTPEEFVELYERED